MAGGALAAVLSRGATLRAGEVRDPDPATHAVYDEPFRVVYRRSLSLAFPQPATRVAFTTIVWA